VAQGVGPEFKPQYQKKKERKKEKDTEIPSHPSQSGLIKKTLGDIDMANYILNRTPID
jgi:hypothetical protein